MAFLIVDTSVFVELERQGRPWPEALAANASGEELAIAAISASELLTGVHRADTERRRSERLELVTRVFADLPVLPFDLESARIHALVWADLVARGQLIGLHDLLIAATAVVHDAAILTLNSRDFSRIPGLTVRQPSW